MSLIERRGNFSNTDYDEEDFDGALRVKVICLGDSAVGKSKLIERFLMDAYKNQRSSTFALNLFRHRTMVDSKPVVVDFWDTAGQEKFNKMHASYYHQAHACILVYDATRKITYKNLSNWYQELRQYRPHIPCICVANKIDADSSITGKRFKFADQHNLPFYFVSAADGTNVVRIFREAIEAAVKYKLNPNDITDDILNALEEFQIDEEDDTPSSSRVSSAEAPTN